MTARAGLPKAMRGWPEHRYVYSTEDGDSCSCGWTPEHFRTDPDEWDAHIREPAWMRELRP